MHVYTPSSNRFKHLSHMIITSRKWSRFRSPFYSRVRDLMQNDAVVDHDTYLSLANVFLCVSTGGTHSISILSQTPLLSRSCPLFSIPGWSLLSESTFMMLMSWRWWIQLCHISVTFSGFIWYCILLCWCDRSLVYFSWENMSSVKKNDFFIYATQFWIRILSKRH